MLTQEGQEAARECLMRSGLPDTSETTANSEGPSDLNLVNIDSAEEETMSLVDLRRKKSTDIPLEYIEKVSFQLAFYFYISSNTAGRAETENKSASLEDKISFTIIHLFIYLSVCSLFV